MKTKNIDYKSLIVMKSDSPSSGRKAFKRRPDDMSECQHFKSSWCKAKTRTYDGTYIDSCQGHSMCPRNYYVNRFREEELEPYGSSPETLEREAEERVKADYMEKTKAVVPNWRFTWGLPKRLHEDCEEENFEFVDLYKEMRFKVSSFNSLIDDGYCYYRCRKQHRLSRADVKEDISETLEHACTLEEKDELGWREDSEYNIVLDAELRRRRQRCQRCKAKRMKVVREIARVWVLAHHFEKDEGAFVDDDGIVYKSYRYRLQMQKARELETPIEWIITLDETIDKLETLRPRASTLIDQLKNMRTLLVKETRGLDDFLIKTILDRNVKHTTRKDKHHNIYEFGAFTIKVEK